MTQRNYLRWLPATAALLLVSAVIPVHTASGQVIEPLPAGVEKLCTIPFDHYTKYPARVEQAALSCLQQAAERLKREPARKLVLVGTADIHKDIQAVKNGMMRETEDATGADVRFEDLAAYRALNTKGYLVRWYHQDPKRILPTTNEWVDGQYVTFYLVPDDANFNQNYVGSTKINEKPCSIKPCYTPDEETLTAQQQSRLQQAKQ